MEQSHSLTEGKILGSLIRFALPVFLALFLQALYGGVDLLVVGQFAHTEDVSGVSSGSMLMQTVTMIIRITANTAKRQMPVPTARILAQRLTERNSPCGNLSVFQRETS